MNLLDIQNLTLETHTGTLIVDDISLSIGAGRVTALVGESGSGKSLTAMSIPGLLPAAIKRIKGRCLLHQQDIYALSEADLQELRGTKIAMVFQEPMTALNPLHTVKKQISEMLSLHGRYTQAELDAKVLDLLKEVKIPQPEQKCNAYPHELSGGQRQRVMIAIALANKPDLLILDEPTTALDVTVQVQILQLLKSIRCKYNMAMLLISHDLDMVAHTADYIYVMQNGKIVEEGPTSKVLSQPSHEYTQYLLDATPKGTARPIASDAKKILEIHNLSVKYSIQTGFLKRVTDHIHAVNQLNLILKQGETVGIVGESGSGKSSFASAILQLIPYEGEVTLLDQKMHLFSRSELRAMRHQFQPVFQDPYAALSPRMSIKDILLEGLDLHHPNMLDHEKMALISKTLEDISMAPEATLERYPHEFSGGQRQRIAIARALVLKPKLMILDEPTSALDRTVQKQVLDLLKDLQEKYGLAYIFISHDLGVVRSMAHQMIVMKSGQVVEQGPSEAIFNDPQGAYTQNLLNAAMLKDV